jgi:hypothetical protein
MSVDGLALLFYSSLCLTGALRTYTFSFDGKISARTEREVASHDIVPKVLWADSRSGHGTSRWALRECLAWSLVISLQMKLLPWTEQDLQLVRGNKELHLYQSGCIAQAQEGSSKGASARQARAKPSLRAYLQTLFACRPATDLTCATS